MGYKELICSVIVHIEQGIKGKPDYDAMASEVGFSYHHIRGVFKKETNISLAQYIATRKIANAAFEIRHLPRSITDIAMDYEFESVDTFTRAFKRDTGLTPSKFRKSSHLCGRRIIAPGVYAPVIFDLENPRFRLLKLLEVNEMAKMQKTADSCILYGVPKVHFGRMVDGEEQHSFFPMCLQAVLNYMGQNISYAELMAYTGIAFRQRWDSNGWAVWAVDSRVIYERHLETFERGFQGAGRNFNISEDTAKSINKDDAIALIKAELDCGRPVIALGVVGPPEPCIITGYRDNGETILGWSLFQEWECEEFDESGYFVKHNWWPDTEAIITIGEEVGHRTPDKEVLTNALMLMTTQEIRTYGGKDLYYGGRKAYEAWAQALEAGVYPGDVADAHGDMHGMLGGRAFAAKYVAMMAKKYPKAAAELTECAKLLSEVAQYNTKIWEESKAGLRKEIAAIVREAADIEQKACAVLQQAVAKL